MKILLGAKFNWGGDPTGAIEIEGVGIFDVIPNEDGFDFIELKKKHLVKLRKLIDKEIDDEKKTNIS